MHASAQGGDGNRALPGNNRSPGLRPRQCARLCALAHACGCGLRNDWTRHLRILSADCRSRSGGKMVRPAKWFCELRRHNRTGSYWFRRPENRKFFMALRNRRGFVHRRYCWMGFCRGQSRTGKLGIHEQSADRTRSSPGGLATRLTVPTKTLVQTIVTEHSIYRSQHHPTGQGVTDKALPAAAIARYRFPPTAAGCSHRLYVQIPSGGFRQLRKSSTVAKRLSDTHRQQGSNRHPTIDDELCA